MRIDIGSRVWTRDNEEIGSVDRVVIDPDTKDVDAIVVHRGKFLTRDVVVPLSLVQDSGDDGVRLRIGRAELHDLPDFVERHYSFAPSAARTPISEIPGSVLIPAARQGVSGLPTTYEAVEDEVREPDRDIEISEGTEVRALDGVIGYVDEVLTDPITNRASDIVVKKGQTLTRDTRIPIEFVAKTADDHIQLSLTTQQVLELPIPVVDRYLTVEGDEP
ncbi:MAG: PRC-barrel domain-containing protein [Chloroflexota bacterium]|jgi:uncharacterized protein YrrD